MINNVFGFGLCSVSCFDDDKDPNVLRKLCVYVSEAAEWFEDGYCSDYLEEEPRDTLWDIGLGEECEGIFSLNKSKYTKNGVVDVKQLTKEEICDKLVAAGFVYNEEFEKFMVENGSPE